MQTAIKLLLCAVVTFASITASAAVRHPFEGSAPFSGLAVDRAEPAAMGSGSGSAEPADATLTDEGVTLAPSSADFTAMTWEALP